MLSHSKTRNLRVTVTLHSSQLGHRPNILSFFQVREQNLV